MIDNFFNDSQIIKLINVNKNTVFRRKLPARDAAQILFNFNGDWESDCIHIDRCNNI